VPSPRAGCSVARVQSVAYLFGGQQLWPAVSFDDFFAASIAQPGVVQYAQLLPATYCAPAPAYTAEQYAAASTAGRAAAAATLDPSTGLPLAPGSEALELVASLAEYDFFAPPPPPADAAAPGHTDTHAAAGAAAAAASDASAVPGADPGAPPSLRPPHRAWHASCALLTGPGGAPVVVICGGASAAAPSRDKGLCGESLPWHSIKGFHQVNKSAHVSSPCPLRL
jgi:hypothetical protein